MIKSLKYAGIITAALFATVPVAGTSNFLSLQNNVVKADTEDTSTVELKLGLKKSTLIFPVGHYEDFYKQEGKILNNITTNHGNIDQDADRIDSSSFSFYKKNKNGKIDWAHPLDEDSYLPEGTEGIVVVKPSIENLDADQTYTFLTTTDSSGDLVSASSEPNASDSFDGSDDGESDASPAIKIPFIIGNKQVTHKAKNKLYGYVKASHKVRTYTSRGKFSKKYVSSHHTYRLSSKRRIRNHGVCYKIYGKNQYIPAKYLSLK